MFTKLLSNSLFFDMLRMRMIEEKIASEYTIQPQPMRCPVHLSIGQEAISVGISKNLKFSDQVFSNHRCHYHYLAKGGSLKKMIAELYGKVTGTCKGRGGSMHLFDPNYNVTASVPIVGSIIPIAVGTAWHNKIKRNKKKVIVYLGDGCTEEGVFHESLDFASLMSLNILFVVENNSYSVYSHIDKRQSTNRSAVKLAKAHGILAKKIDGNNIIEIYKKSKKILSHTKSPYLLELKTFRVLEHCGPNNDDNLNYRKKKEIEFWLKKCPIETYEKLLLRNKIITDKKINHMKIKINKEIMEAFEFAKKSSFPQKTSIMNYIYA